MIINSSKVVVPYFSIFTLIYACGRVKPTTKTKPWHVPIPPRRKMEIAGFLPIARISAFADPRAKMHALMWVPSTPGVRDRSRR